MFRRYGQSERRSQQIVRERTRVEVYDSRGRTARHVNRDSGAAAATTSSELKGLAQVQLSVNEHIERQQFVHGA